MSPRGVHHVEPAVGLDVEDEVELRRLLVGQVPADLEPGGVQQHVDAAVALAHVGHDGGDRVGVAQVHRVVVGGAAGRLDGLDRGECGVEPFEAGQLALDGHRRRPSRPPPSSARRSWPSGRRGRCGTPPGRGLRSGAGVRSSRWKVPPEAAARSAVIAETMLPAAPVTTKTESAPSTMPRRGTASPSSAGNGASTKADAEALVVEAADLHAARIEQRLLDQLRRPPPRSCGWPGSRPPSPARRAAPSVRLGKADHGAAQRVGGAGRVVAVAAAQPGGRHQERLGVETCVASRVQRP